MNVIAMDAGQTGIRARVFDDGALVNEVEAPGVLTDRPVVPQLAEVAALANTHGRSTLAVGASGLGDEVTADALLKLVRPLGVEKVLLAHDSVTSYLGAVGDEPGCVIAAGTGVVTLAVGEHDMARVDGWGYLLGDAGSGFWIGRAGLDAALRAYDGRGPATALSERVHAEFPDIEGAYLEVQADPYRVARVASWARFVAEHAATDEVCATIIDRAAAELATSVIAGLRRVGQAERPDPLVSTVGKVFSGQRLHDEFARLIRAQFPDARIVDPAGSGLDGAAQLATLRADSPLWQRVSAS